MCILYCMYMLFYYNFMIEYKPAPSNAKTVKIQTKNPSNLTVNILEQYLQDKQTKLVSAFCITGIKQPSTNCQFWNVRCPVVSNQLARNANVMHYIVNNIQGTISQFWFVKNMSINPKSVQKSAIECKKV